MIDLLFAILAFLLMIGLVVTIHEGGHFITALLCKITVLEFSLGFGPKIFQKPIGKGKDKILFTLRCIPMGGFVKPLDKSTVSEEHWNSLTPQQQSRSFASVARWKKALMIFGGPLSNFILAIALFVGIFYSYGSTGISPVVAKIYEGSIFENSGIKPGDEIVSINNIPVNLTQDTYSVLIDSIMNNPVISVIVNNKDGNKNYLVNTSSVDYNKLLVSQYLFHGLQLQGQTGEIKISSVKENGPAEKAGIQSGDILISLNDVKIDDLSQYISIVRESKNITLNVKLRRNNKEKYFLVPIETKKSEEGDIGYIGIFAQIINPTNIKTLEYSIGQAFTQGISTTITHTSTNISTIKKLILGQISTKAISGPLTIAEYSGESLQMGLQYFLQMMALISIAIGVFNLLPIPMLDGGYLFQYFVETIRGKNYNNKEALISNYIGIICLMGLFTLAMGNDLIRYVQMLAS